MRKNTEIQAAVPFAEGTTVSVKTTHKIIRKQKYGFILSLFLNNLNKV